MSRPCAACGADVAMLARFCPECGAPNPARRTVVGTVIALAVLVPAIAVAIYAATRWEQPLIPGDRLADEPLPSQPVPGRDDNFDWLALAMKACDEKATAEPNALHILVVPIAYDAATVELWRRVALNRIGNALILPGDEILGALRRKNLSIATQSYVFSIRDEKSGNIRKWDAATGVKWFSIADAGELTLFRMQYRPGGRGRDDSWGNTVVHQKGNCYWVNALYED
jgi:hypothetical protein